MNYILTFVERPMNVGSSPIQMEKGGKTYIATVVRGKPSVLQGTWHGEKSGVKLEIPAGIHGIILACVHTDPTPYLKFIPENECFVAPTVEYSLQSFINPTPMDSATEMFKITIPHVAKEHNIRESIIVRKGEIALGDQANFETIKRIRDANDLLTNTDRESSFYTVGKNNITICTGTFCQFTITSSEKACNITAYALIYGGIDEAGQDILAKTRVFLCSPLYELWDYKLVMPYSHSIFSNFSTDLSFCLMSHSLETHLGN